MLHTTVKPNEHICIGDDIWITIKKANPNRIRLLIKAPKHIPINIRKIEDDTHRTRRNSNTKKTSTITGDDAV